MEFVPKSEGQPENIQFKRHTAAFEIDWSIADGQWWETPLTPRGDD
jgi:hypothetical protein